MPRGFNGRKCRHALDDGRPEKFKRIIIINPAFKASTPQYGKGNFAVNSPAYWRTLAAMSNPIFQNLCFIRAHFLAKLRPVKIRVPIWIFVGVLIIVPHWAKSQVATTNAASHTNSVETGKQRAKFVIDMASKTPISPASPSECIAYMRKIFSNIQNRWDDSYKRINSPRHKILGKDVKIVVAFNMYPDGHISDVNISGDTNSIVTPLCVQVIKDCSPFPKWPSQMHSLVNQDYWELKFSFSLNEQFPLPN